MTAYEAVTDRRYRARRSAFIAGQLDNLRIGGYGGTMTVRVVQDGVLIRTSRPKRRQRLLRPNSRSVREAAVQAAEEALERLRGGRQHRTDAIPRRKAGPAGVITPRDVWLAYLRLRLGAIPEDEILGWGRKDVVAYMRRLPPTVRAGAPSPAYMYSVVQAARRLDRDGVVPLDANLADIQPGDLDEWATTQLASGASPHTVVTYLTRFRNAVRRYQEKYPHKWGDLLDPTRGIVKIGTRAIQPPEIGEERAVRLMARLRARGAWRALAATMIAHATGRRIGSISGARDEIHLDAPPLCAADFRRTEDGILEVRWRAAAQKGKGYGRGDVVLPATRQLEEVYRWLTRFHPNPLGPEYPLIWAEDDPTQAEPYHRLRRELAKAWREEFGEPKPRGLCWHSFCRTTISTIADELGTLAAAEYTGRSPRTVEKVYKRLRPQTARLTAQRLDDVRRQQRIRPKRTTDWESAPT